MTYYPSDDVILAARDLRDALLEDCPFGNSETPLSWLARTFPQLLALSECSTEDEE